jgi:Mor family transcriptional regulator
LDWCNFVGHCAWFNVWMGDLMKKSYMNLRNQNIWIDRNAKMTYLELGKKYNLSQARCRQIFEKHDCKFNNKGWKERLGIKEWV